MNAVKLINIGNLVTYSSGDNSMVSLEKMEIVISDGKIVDIGRKLGDADEELYQKLLNLLVWKGRLFTEN